jgi:hypothetical protein
MDEYLQVHKKIQIKKQYFSNLGIKYINAITNHLNQKELNYMKKLNRVLHKSC